MPTKSPALHVLSPAVSCSTRIPLAFERISAGFPSPAADYVEGTLDLNDYLVPHPAATFFVRVAGDSMTGAGIHTGDVLVVDRSLDATDGRVVVAVIDGELTVKRLCRKYGRIALHAENAAYPAIRIRDATELVIWGVVTAVVHRL